MIVYGSWASWKYARKIDDLPVAVKPWMLTNGGEGRCAWNVSNAQAIGKPTYGI